MLVFVDYMCGNKITRQYFLGGDMYISLNTI